MNPRRQAVLPSEQAAIRTKRFHPSGHFEEFARGEIEQSISDRFEKIARKYPDHIQLNAAANRTKAV